MHTAFALSFECISVSQYFRYILSEAGIVTLFDRRYFLTDKSFNDIVNDTGHKLHGLLPRENQFDSNSRAKNTFNAPTCRISRFQNSFLIRNSIMHPK